MSIESACDIAATATIVLAGCWLLVQRRFAIAAWVFAAGTAWLAGSVTGTLALVHRPPMTVALLALPIRGCPPPRRSAAFAAAVAICIAVLSTWSPSIALSLLLALSLVLATAWICRASVDSSQHAGPAVCYGVLLAIVAFLRLAYAPAATISVLYSCGVMLVVTSMVVGLVRASHRLVVDLMASPHTDALEWRLRAALGDPTLRLVVGGAGAGVGAEASTTIRFEGRAVGVVEHAARVQLDPRVAAGLGAVAALNLRALELRRAASRALDETARAEQELATARQREAQLLARHVEEGPQRQLALAAELVSDHALLDLIDAARRELSVVAAGLAPQRVTRAGLRNALEERASLSPVPVSMTIDAVTPLDELQTFGVLSICTEALTNSAKHARASHIGLEVRTTGDQVDVTVWDDGVGIDAGDEGARRGRQGLRGMRATADSIGASLVVTRRTEGGTCVLLRIPTAGLPW